MVPFYAIFRYSASCSDFGLGVPMSKKQLTNDDKLAIQVGLQKGIKVAQIARNIGKDRATIGRKIKAHRRLVPTFKGNNCIQHKTDLYWGWDDHVTNKKCEYREKGAVKNDFSFFSAVF